MSDEIRWINHAGYELRSNGVRIVHDPWIEGYAFQDGWALISPSRYDYEQFAGVDYIWISHEHPDHFAPGVLRKIPEHIRSNITLLHRETRDKRIVAFCRKLGFKVQELPDRQSVALGNGLTITCGTAGDDSWCMVTTPEATYFNANDCVGVNWQKVAASLDRRIDVLLTQFSYASWAGNPGDGETMQRRANEKLLQMDEQVAAFRPRTLIPFASYVWFCRPENFHLNAGVNRIDLVHRRFRDRLQTVVLYPGDTWHLGDEAFDSEGAVGRYLADLDQHTQPLPAKEQAQPLEKLAELSRKHQGELARQNTLWLLRPLQWNGFLRPVRIFLADLGQGIEYSMFGGIRRTGLERPACELEFTSSSFANMLSNGYGYSTLYINGRFRELVPGAFARLSRHFAISGQNAVGYRFPGLLLRRDYMQDHLSRLLRALWTRSGSARAR
jgi:hypothetical protein